MTLAPPFTNLSTLRLRIILCFFPFTLLSAEDKEDQISTEEFKVQVPKDHLCLVAIDRGEPGNRMFLTPSEPTRAPGVDPVAGDLMQVPAEIFVSLVYPEKRENAKLRPFWKVRARHRYLQKRSLLHQNEPDPNIAIKVNSTLEVDLGLSIGYNVEMATEVQKYVYQKDGQIHTDFERNIIETPITPAMHTIDTGIEGTLLYEIPYGEVKGIKRSILILVSDSFENAQKCLLVSNKNPKFRWDIEWFDEVGNN